jgi:hypothetical protein
MIFSSFLLRDKELATRGRNDAVHAQVLHQLSVVIVGMSDGIDCQAKPSTLPSAFGSQNRGG